MLQDIPDKPAPVPMGIDATLLRAVVDTAVDAGKAGSSMAWPRKDTMSASPD